MKISYLTLGFIFIAIISFTVSSCSDDDEDVEPNNPTATCTDEVQNGDETAIDCGGSDCPPCEALCDDGILNGNEEEIDCGGDCEPCPTCNDGILNGNEEEVDCGGDCDPCPTCNDGIENGEETGVDCGGPDCENCDPEDGIFINGTEVFWTSYKAFLAGDGQMEIVFSTEEGNLLSMTLTPTGPLTDGYVFYFGAGFWPENKLIYDQAPDMTFSSESADATGTFTVTETNIDEGGEPAYITGHFDDVLLYETGGGTETIAVEGSFVEMPFP